MRMVLAKRKFFLPGFTMAIRSATMTKTHILQICAPCRTLSPKQMPYIIWTFIFFVALNGEKREKKPFWTCEVISFQMQSRTG